MRDGSKHPQTPPPPSKKTNKIPEAQLSRKPPRPSRCSLNNGPTAAIDLVPGASRELLLSVWFPIMRNLSSRNVGRRRLFLMKQNPIYRNHRQSSAHSRTASSAFFVFFFLPTDSSQAKPVSRGKKKQKMEEKTKRDTSCLKKIRLVLASSEDCSEH